MEIIASTTEGYLISATESEVKEILRSVQGSVPKEILIGQKIPAIDYASTITKLKTLPDNYSYKRLLESARGLQESLDEIKNSVESSLDI